MHFRPRKRSALPGFRLTMGFTLFYIGLLVMIPLSAVVLKGIPLGWTRFIEIATTPRVLASFKLSLGASLVAALANALFGTLVAWVLTRYRFPGRGFLDGLVDLPFALPTAVAGLALTAVYGPNGWLGRPLYAMGIQTAFSRLGIMIALTFIGLPFVVRTVQPVLQDLDREIEEAAVTLGASRWQSFRRVLLPTLFPSILTGFTLAFARALGEYGSVIFISGNMPMRTEITPLLIMTKLAQFDTAGAAVIAIVMLAISFVLLLAINLLQGWVGESRARA